MTHCYTLRPALLVIVLAMLVQCTPKPAAIETTSQSLQVQFPHPLNPLDASEIKQVRQILLDEGKIDTTYRFYLISLNEPPKKEIQDYKPGSDFRREAFASVYHRPTNKTFEAIVDLKAKRTTSFTQIAGVTPGTFLGDSIGAEIVMHNEEWLAGLAKRGIPPDSTTVITYVFAGEMGLAPPDHRELICVPRYKNPKFSDLPIDGLVAYVDLTDGKVMKVLDDGGKGFYKPEDISYFNEDSAKLLLPHTKPLKITQPEGPTFSVEGFEVKGTVWSFRLGLHNREGLVIYDAKYNDAGVTRRVMHRASLAEMYVPYGSLDLGLASWNYFDGGAYRMGQSERMMTQSSPAWNNKMKLGADIPENSSFLPGFYHTEKGDPIKIDSVIAIFEEYPGPATRHGKFSQDARNLVVKYYTRVGNYDYGFKWVFREDGTIDLKLDLTGIVGIKAVNRTSDMPGGNDDHYNGTYYGTLVAPHVEAVNHQHFFSFRLDLDVDGTENIVEEMNTVALPPGKNNPWNNAFIKQMSLIKTESDGQRDLNPAANRHWMVANAKSLNGLGQQKSYILMPGHNASPFAAPGSAARKMADFLEHQVMVTAYNEKELYPAGDYPNSRGIKDGMASWNNNEDLVGKDVVMWYNMGVTHIVRPEDWPVMNVHQIGFSLMPFGFFERNPLVTTTNAPDRMIVVPDKSAQPDISLCVPLPVK